MSDIIVIPSEDPEELPAPIETPAAKVDDAAFAAGVAVGAAATTIDVANDRMTLIEMRLSALEANTQAAINMATNATIVAENAIDDVAATQIDEEDEDDGVLVLEMPEIAPPDESEGGNKRGRDKLSFW